MSERIVAAAGGVVIRAGESDEAEVCLVHRPRYDDWTLPKGKLDAGETFEEAALREVLEETGLRCSLRRELSSTQYTDGQGRPKIVRYWLMEVEGGEFEPNDEVDEVRWVRPQEAVDVLTYAHDRALVSAAGL